MAAKRGRYYTIVLIAVVFVAGFLIGRSVDIAQARKPVQVEPAYHERVLARLKMMNKMLDIALEAIENKDSDKAKTYLDWAESRKNDMFYFDEFAAPILGISAGAWAVFADSFDVHIVLTTWAMSLDKWDNAAEYVRFAKEQNKRMQELLPPHPSPK